ncbi:MAG: OstA-like protein [Flavobacteriales bacterium]
MAQKTVEVVQAEFLEFDDKIADGAQRLVGYVVLSVDDVTLSCDSAYIYENKDFKAFNNIHINQGDSIHLYGDDLDYVQNRNIATLRKNVMFKDNDMTLKTELMTYNLDSSIGSYLNGGVITSTANNNKLISQSGSYNSDADMFYFKKNVVLSNPDYTVKSDTLNYNNLSERAFFFGPTTILGEDADIYCENGWYDTKTEICQFSENATITSESTLLEGDSLYFDGSQNYGEAFRNVMISDSLEKFTIQGNYGYHDSEQDSSFVVGETLYTQEFEEDSLFLHADTLLSIKDTLNQSMIKAYHKVRFFKPDMQGKADSLVWQNADSLIQMFNAPVVWSDESQMTADTIYIGMRDGKMHELHARKNAFIISSKGAEKYDQIKGRELIGHFKNNELYKLDMLGNGQAVYYPLQEKNGLQTIQGVNKIDCSDIVIYMKDNAIERIKFLTKPKGAMIPIRQAAAKDEVLEGFIWTEHLRPLSKEDIFLELAD